MPKDTDKQGAGIDGYLFRLIATFEAAAMQQLGKIAHPVTGDVEVSLDGARDSIEMLAMVQRKTEGNLNDDEGKLLQHVLYQLRMNYVDVARSEETPESGPSGDSGARPAPADAESGSGAGVGADEGPAGSSGEADEGPEQGDDPGEADRDEDR